MINKIGANSTDNSTKETAIVKTQDELYKTSIHDMLANKSVKQDSITGIKDEWSNLVNQAISKKPAELNSLGKFWTRFSLGFKNESVYGMKEYRYQTVLENERQANTKKYSGSTIEKALFIKK